MQLSADLSLYPLDQNYIPPIQAIIHHLQAGAVAKGLRIERNELSTQLFGDYDAVMDLVTREAKRCFETHRAVLVCKFVVVG